MRPCFTMLVLVALLALAANAPPATAQNVEDKAGQMLFEAGKKAFERGEFSAAAEKFEKALTVAFGGDVARAPVPLLNLLGRSLAELGRCSEAVPLLVAAESTRAPEAAALARTQAEITCRRKLAELAIREGRCKDAMPHLQRLEGRISQREEAWRQGAIEHCLARLTDFDTSTPDSKAAYQLFQAARSARDRRRYERAVDLYRKALAVVDEPLIRTELAGVLIERMDDCSGGLEALGAAAVSEPLASAVRRCGAEAGAPAPPSGSGPASTSFQPAPSSDGDGGSGMAVLGWIALGASAVGIAAGGVLIALGETELARQNGWEHQAKVAPTTEQQDLFLEKARVANKTAEGNRYGGIAALGIGVAALGTGIVLLILDPGDDEVDEARVRVTPIFGPTSMGLSVRF